MFRESFLVPTRDGAFDCYLDVSSLIQSNVCDEENAPYVSGALTSYLALLSDSPLRATLGHKPRKLFSAFRRKLLSRPIAESINAFSDLFDKVAFASSLSGNDGLTGPFIEEMIDTPVFREYHHYFKTGDPLCLRYILTFLCFLKKASYHEDDFNTVAFREWLEIEEKLNQLDIPDVRSLKDIISAILPDPDTDYWYPKFGPGAVSEDGIRGMVLKASNLSYHPRLARAFSSIFIGGKHALSDVIPDGSRWACRNLSIDYSTLRFVPKDMRKSRSICMEPNSFMYFQQLVKHWMYRAIEKSVVSRNIPLNDQSVNQRLALHGSTYGSVDTIDLSAASDSVHIDLVKKLFPRRWLYFLLATRTSKVRTPDEQIRIVKKFAPMGSALCFPVQCLVFTSVCIYALLERDGLVPSINEGVQRDVVYEFLRRRVAKLPEASTAFRSFYEPFSVFGDDIICDSRVTDRVTSILTSLGFKVNTSKSFTSSHAVRESCGVYAFNGYDVTPFRYKIAWHRGSLSPSCVAGLVDSINNAGDFGYLHLRRSLLHLVLYSPLEGVKKRYAINPILFVERDSGISGIITKDAKNDHLQKRYHADWQRDECRSYEVKIKQRNFGHSLQKEYVEFYAYLQDMGARYRASTNEPLEASFARYRPEETGVGWRWTPVG